MRRVALAAAASVALSACALKGDVRRVEQEVARLGAQQAEADARRAAQLDRVLALQQAIIDSLIVEQRRLAAIYGEQRADMTEVQRQLVQIQELTGQSQQRLTELRAQIRGRLQDTPEFDNAAGAAPGAQPGGAGPGPGDLGARELYNLSLQQLRRGSPQTARAGFEKLLQDFPSDPVAADAQFHIGESWEATHPDSAQAAYELVAERFPDSERAPSSLYKLGLLAEREGDAERAQLYFLRVVSGYPRSDEAQLARSKLSNAPGQ